MDYQNYLCSLENRTNCIAGKKIVPGYGQFNNHEKNWKSNFPMAICFDPVYIDNFYVPVFTRIKLFAIHTNLHK